MAIDWKAFYANGGYSNDPNDPGNGIYIFCGGIPVLKVVNDPCVTNNEVGIDEVAEVLKNIKDMYRNSLNGKPI